MNKTELARLFYRELEKIVENDQLDGPGKVAAQFQLLGLLFLEVTRQERLHFTTLFARITYACQKHGVPGRQQYLIHHFRKASRAVALGDQTDHLKVFRLGLKVVSDSISVFFQSPIPASLEGMLPTGNIFPERPVEIKSYTEKIRVVATEDDAEKNQLIAFAEEMDGEEVRIQYNIPERNENFFPTIQAIREHFQFPLTINLLEVEIDKNGVLRPRGFVVEPDYLLDVTAVAESFKDGGVFLDGYLLKKYLPFNSSIPLILGNIANFFLDQLMVNPEWQFKELFPKVFHQSPLVFAMLDDRSVREVYQSSQIHFLTIKEMIRKGFGQNEINPKACYLEPTFYSETYGLQGRLDLFFHKPEGRSAIVELKSGSAYRPNIYGISQNHFTQTLLYDLIVRSAFGKKLDPINYILYSKLIERPLRFAPSIKAQQMEAIQVRNQLLALEQRMWDLQGESPPVFNRIRAEGAKGYIQRDLSLFEGVYGGASPLERHYFIAFSRFIAREHRLAKIGIQGMARGNGLASLWLNDSENKETQFEIISRLKVKENRASQPESIIVFEKTEHTNPLANFRQGDIAVLYPFVDVHSTVLDNQIFKCNILRITDKEVEIRLRYPQFNEAIFDQFEYWNLEHDLLDGNFTGMYRQLFAFMQALPEKKDLLFTNIPPAKPESHSLSLPEELTGEQQTLFQKIINARDYFLLWGPPGTGKTSKMLKHMVGYLWRNTSERLLLLAYTNRAVDEICEAVESFDPELKEGYIRIGSRYSTDERFRKNLLDSKIREVNNRKALREVLLNHRIYISTVSSIGGKQELLNLMNFDRVIIDEASQILEPMLVGLLPRFARFVLIGDHKQLPAVVVQDEESSDVEYPDLRSIGLTNMRHSLFERLYRRAQENDWHWAFGRLSHQGRMHADIMEFPNQFFYHAGLNILPAHLSISQLQQLPLTYTLPPDASELESQLCSRRVLFLPTQIDEGRGGHKTNFHEAVMMRKLVRSFFRIYQANGMDILPHSLGIITPYRAQIAQIRKELRDHDLPVDLFTIDTVERYQGGARDIILISLCTNKLHQLDSLVSLSEEGIDRKLNVALTRARQHLILVGNPDVLKGDATYEAFISKYSIDVETTSILKAY